MSPQLELQLARERYEPGEAIRGTILVAEGGNARSLEVLLEYKEKTEDYSTVATSVSSPLNVGDLTTGTSFAFELILPPDALPSYRSPNGELYWELDVKSDEHGRDTHVRRRIQVGPEQQSTMVEPDGPEQAFELGVSLAERGDLEGAEAAYRQADEGGVPEGAFNLGVLLEERGDLEAAEAAYGRADEGGVAEGASNLGALLKDRGDLEAAEAAFRRADEGGVAEGALNLGVLLEERGDDLEGAEAAYRRAASADDEELAEQASAALENLGAAEA